MSRVKPLLRPFPTNDPKDPLRWPSSLKLAAVLVTSLANFVTNMGATAMSVAIPLLMAEFKKSQADATQTLTMSFLFLGIGNNFWVPIARKFGKRTSLLSSMVMQTGMLAWTASAGSFNSLLVARCLQGFAGAAGESIVPEIVADVTFIPQRGAMMSIYIFLISSGSAVGPLIAGFMTALTAETWRSFYWLCCGAAGFNFILIFFLYPESNFTRPDLDVTADDQMELLRNRQTYEEYEEGPYESLSEEVQLAPSTNNGYTIHKPSCREILFPFSYNADVKWFTIINKPLTLLLHPSVWWGTFVCAITLSPQLILIYNMSPLLEAPPYHFSTEEVGMMQIAAIVGFLLACFGGGKLSDIISNFMVRRTSGYIFWPEQRLISLIPGMLFGPAGCILLAFACGNKLPWILIAFGFGLVSFGSIYTTNIAITYIVHRHQREAAECLVMINGFKNVVAFACVSGAVAWVDKSGYIQVYMIMFTLNMVILIFAQPLYLFDARKRRNMEIN